MDKSGRRLVLTFQSREEQKKELQNCNLELSTLRGHGTSGAVVFGFVVVGIPESQLLELKARFPDECFKGQNPRLKEAVKQDITKQEREQIVEHLHLEPDIEPKFECNAVIRYQMKPKRHQDSRATGKSFGFTAVKS